MVTMDGVDERYGVVKSGEGVEGEEEEEEQLDKTQETEG